MKRRITLLLLWFTLGVAFFGVQALHSVFHGGKVHILLLVLGGLYGIVFGALNTRTWFRKTPIAVRSFIVAITAFGVEFMLRYVLDVRGDQALWTFIHNPDMILTTVIVWYGFLTFLVYPAFLWIDNQVRYLKWNERVHRSLKSYYYRFLHLQ